MPAQPEGFLPKGGHYRELPSYGKTEASRASVTSTETELKLTNVARASLEELLIDYERAIFSAVRLAVTEQR